MDEIATRDDDYEHRFFRAMAVGSAIGSTGLWVVLTVAFSIITDESLGNVAGLSLLPSLFCGPFFGALVTTATVERTEDHAAVVLLAAVDHPQAA